MWFVNESNKKEFLGGKSDFCGAAKEAQKCPEFKVDVEEEIFDDEVIISCYNCRFRRWTEKSFACQQPIKME